MEKYLNKFYDIIDKIGKQNFLLIVFIIIVVAITGIVQTFSLYTELSGVSIVDGIKTYQFILNANNTTNTIIIPANSSKNIDITVNNDSSAKLLYGIYYTSNNNDVNIGYLPRTSHLPNATIEANSDNVVTIRVKNSSDNNASITFGVKYGFENGGELTLEEGQSWLEEYEESLDDSILANHVINLYNDGSAINTVHIGADASKPEVSLNATKNIMLDNNGEYRYYGANPNNYVLFNNELWRIISSSNVKSSTTDTKGEQRIKLVKAEILADDNGLNKYSWDSSESTINSGRGVNDWSQADLQTELNTLYLNKGSDVCYTGSNNATTACAFSTTGLNAEAKTLIDDALYHLGATSDISTFFADNFYSTERSTSTWPGTTGTCDDGACPRATKWSGKVGLMYMSDFAYSVDLSSCNVSLSQYSNTEGCGDSWLKPTASIMPINSSISGAAANYFITSASLIMGRVTYEKFSVMPTVYLKSDVKWLSGDGTSESPYILDDGTGGSSSGDDTTEQLSLKTYLAMETTTGNYGKLDTYNLILEQDGTEKTASCQLQLTGYLSCGSYPKNSTIKVLGVNINGTELYSAKEDFEFNITTNNTNLFIVANSKGVEEYKICSEFNSTCDSRIGGTTGEDVGSSTGGNVGGGTVIGGGGSILG